MMRNRKAVAAGALAVSAVLLFAGCSAEGSDGVVEIIAVDVPGPEGEAMAAIIDEYNAGQGITDGVRVKLVELSRDDQLGKEATLMSTQSSEYDIYNTASYVIAQHSIGLEPLDFVDESIFLPVALDSLSVDGQLLAVPKDVSNHFLYYRSDLVDALLADPAEQATFREIARTVLGTERDPVAPEEWTWDDFIATSAYFTKQYNPESPTEYGAAMQMKNLLFNAMIWDDVLWSFGGGWTDANGEADLESSAAQKAVAVYADIYTKGLTSPDAVNAEYPETNAALSAGNAALAIQWSAAYNSLNDPEQSPATAGKIAIAPVPGEVHRTHIHTLGSGLNKYSEHKEEATKFLAYLASESVLGDYAAAGGIPPMPGVLEGMASERPEYPIISQHVNEYGYAPPAIKNPFSAFTALAEQLSGAWAGKQDIDEALANANRELAKLIDE